MTDKRQAIFDKITELRDRLEDYRCEMTQLDDACEQLGQERDAAIQKIETLQTFNEKWQRDYEALLISRTDAIESAKQWERECDKWRERRDLAIVRAEEAEEREDAYLDRAEKAEAEREQANLLAQDLIGQLQGRLSKTEEELAEQKERGNAARLHKMKKITRLRKALALYANPDNWRFSHDKENNLLWITSLGPDYAIEILNEVSRESSEEKETVNALS